MSRRAGFTLIELLVAITIMGVMAVLCWRGLTLCPGEHCNNQKI